MKKTAIVTGAASGIGRDIVLNLADEGWRVFALDVDADGLQAVARDSGAEPLICDMADPASVTAIFRQISTLASGVHALICSAGIVCVGSLDSLTPKAVEQVFAVNAIGPWLAVRESLALLKQTASVEEPARVVLIGSISGIRPKVGSGMYAASKAALHVISNVYAAELASEQILVNAIAPGSVDTPMTQQAKAAIATNKAAVRYRTAGAAPLGRVAQPKDITSVVKFFLSPAANFVSGTVVPVDGATRAAFVSTN